MAEPEKSDGAVVDAGGDGGEALNAKPKGGALKDVAQAEQMVQLAIAIPAGCVIGWLLGSWGDRAWHQNWIGIVGLLVGAAGGFVQIFKVTAKYMKDSK